MGKNSSMTNSIIDNKSIMKDESFKDLARYKCLASMLMKLTVPEFKDMDYIDIAKHIVDLKDRGTMSDEELMQSEIDLAETEAGTANEKNTINDVVFYARIPSGKLIKAILKPTLTVNFEMQNSKQKRTIPRSVYYGSSLLRDTVPAGDREYKNIHKVYSIWFCNFNLNLDTFGIEKLKTEYMHRYGIRRYYDDYPNYVGYDEEADLMNITLIELNKLAEFAKTDLERTVAKIFFDTSNSIGSIEKLQKVNLTKYRKVVAGRMDWNAKALELVAEGRVEMVVSALSTFKNKGEDYCINFAKKVLKATDEEIKEAIKEVFN